MAKTPDAILNGKIVTNGSTGDGKRMFLAANTNDSWKDLRIEIDTDDCDSTFAKKWAKRIIKCVEACRGIENPKDLKTAVNQTNRKKQHAQSKNTRPS